VDPHAPRAIALAGRRDRIIEVARARGIDRERRQRAQIAARRVGAVPGVGDAGLRRQACLTLDRRVELAPQSTVDH